MARRLFSKFSTTWTRACASSLRNAMCGSLWPVDRRAAAGLIPAGWCPWGCPCRGTVRHLVWGCGAIAGPRRVAFGDGALARGAAGADASDVEDATWSRALLPDLRQRAPLPRRDCPVLRAGPKSFEKFTGHLYTDGSATFPTDPILRRAGWSVVCLDALGNESTAAYGAYGGWNQDSAAAELWALR